MLRNPQLFHGLVLGDKRNLTALIYLFFNIKLYFSSIIVIIYHCYYIDAHIIMSCRQRLDSYRSELRKLQIQNYFTSKRCPSSLKTIQPHDVPPLQQANLQILLDLAKASQVQQNIQTMHRLGWQCELVGFLNARYFNTQEQYYASFTLCNIYYLPEKEPPNQQFTENVLGILEPKRTSVKIVENVLCLLSHLVNDHPFWGQCLILQRNIFEKLSKMLNIFDSGESHIIRSLLSAIYSLLIKNKPHPSMLMVSQKLFETFKRNKQVVVLSISCIAQLTRLFPQQIATKLSENQVFKAVYFEQKTQSNKFMESYIKMAHFGFQQIKSQIFKEQIFPFLCDRWLKVTHTIKCRVLRLIYNIFEKCKIDLDIFWKSKYYQQFLNQFQISDNEQILVQLTYIFVMCLLNLKLQNSEQVCLIQSLKTASRKLESNVQIQGLIQESLILHSKSKINEMI